MTAGAANRIVRRMSLQRSQYPLLALHALPALPALLALPARLALFALLALLALPASARAQATEVAGVFHSVWADPRRAGAAPFLISLVQTADGIATYVSLRPELARVHGGIAALNGRRLVVGRHGTNTHRRGRRSDAPRTHGRQ